MRLPGLLDGSSRLPSSHNWSPSRGEGSSFQFKLARPLLIGFPVGLLQRDLVVLSAGLNPAVDINRPGNDGVLAGFQIAEIDQEKDPTELRSRLGIEPSFLPRAVIDLHFDLGDVRAVTPHGSLGF